MSTENVYYTYIYLDPRKPGHYEYKSCCFLFQPFYVGMGHGDRHLSHLGEPYKARFVKQGKGNAHKLHTILKIHSLGLSPIIVKLAEDISASEAMLIECQYISDIGRRDINNGILTNMTNGGDSAPDCKGSKNAMYGKRGKDHPASRWKRPPEYTARHAKRVTGSGNPMYGKTWTDERKQQFSECIKRRWREQAYANVKQEYTPERLALMSKLSSGSNNPMYGVECTTERRANISKGLLGSPHLKRGRDNHKTKQWAVIDPFGHLYDADDGLEAFCNNHNQLYGTRLNASSLRAANRKGRAICHGRYKGWMACIKTLNSP